MTTYYDWDKNKHSVYSLHYHMIICVKYRQKAFIKENIIDRLKQKNTKTKKEAKGFKNSK